MSIISVDLNCDIGESFGAYKIGNDQAVMDFASSVNIACGFHAGDPSVMRKTVQLALEKKVAIGAHPGLQDLAGFGRREMAISPEDAYNMVIYQLGALWAFVKAEGGIMHHIKPHGALYNMAAANKELAKAIAEAVYKVNPELVVFGLSGSHLVREAQKIGLKAANEVFADRTYEQDGSLRSRKLAGALIPSPAEAEEQLLLMVKKGKVKSIEGTEIAVQADTICIHGDSPHAIAFAQHLYKLLKKEGISLQAP